MKTALWLAIASIPALLALAIILAALVLRPTTTTAPAAAAVHIVADPRHRGTGRQYLPGGMPPPPPPVLAPMP